MKVNVVGGLPPPESWWKHGLKIFVDQKISMIITLRFGASVDASNQPPWKNPTPRCIPNVQTNGFTHGLQLASTVSIHRRLQHPGREFNDGIRITSRHRFRIFRPKQSLPAATQKTKIPVPPPRVKKKTLKKSSRRTVSKISPWQGTCKWGRLFLLYQCCETWVVVSITEWSKVRSLKFEFSTGSHGSFWNMYGKYHYMFGIAYWMPYQNLIAICLLYVYVWY